jgi:hypothetical protein
MIGPRGLNYGLDARLHQPDNRHSRWKEAGIAPADTTLGVCKGAPGRFYRPTTMTWVGGQRLSLIFHRSLEVQLEEYWGGSEEEVGTCPHSRAYWYSS